MNQVHRIVVPTGAPHGQIEIFLQTFDADLMRLKLQNPWSSVEIAMPIDKAAEVAQKMADAIATARHYEAEEDG
jgi:hypothetical protein